MSDFSKFKRPNGAYYAWVEIPTEALVMPIPEGIPWSKKEDGTQKNVGEFALPSAYSLDGSMCMIPLAGMQAPTMRSYSVTERDLADWEGLISSWGYPVELWLTATDYKEKLASEEYSTEEFNAND